jgi:hypothetical protein
MTYDPTLTSLIIAGVIFLVAVFLNASSDWEIVRELSGATEKWTAPLLIRRYRNDAKNRKRVWAEADALHQHGYRAELHRSQREDAALSRAVAIDVRSALAGLGAGEEIMVAYFRA